MERVIIIDGIPHRTFPLARLYFHYVDNTNFSSRWTSQRLAEVLAKDGLIRLSDDGCRYAELLGFQSVNTRAKMRIYLKSIEASTPKPWYQKLFTLEEE